MKKIMSIVMSMLVLVVLTACGNSISNRELKKILDYKGYIEMAADDLKIEAELDLRESIKGLKYNSSNKLLLVNQNGKYVSVIVNPEKKYVQFIPEFDKEPLSIIYKEILNGSKEVNIDTINIFKECLESYGWDFWNEKKPSQAYLSELTGSNGVISTFEAKSIIENYYKDIDDTITEIIYKDDSASPLYFISYSSGTRYNWNGSLDESAYNVWKANTDLQTQRTMTALYGQPYVFEEVYVLFDSDMKKIGTFDNIEDVYDAIEEQE